MRSLERRVDWSTKISLETFHEHRNSDLYTVRYHLVDYMVADIRMIGALSFWASVHTSLLMCTSSTGIEELCKEGVQKG